MNARFALTVFALLAACAAPVAQNAPVLQDPMPASDTCGAAPYANLIGQQATALERVLIMRQVRVIRPDTPVTRDLRPDRINFMIDAGEHITQITCG